jgi:HAD superfamily hydrolase (TIGR01509 family)
MVAIFDLDGTLLDTYQLIRQNYIDVFTKYLPDHEYDEAELESFFGPPLIDSFMGIVHDEKRARALSRIYRFISKNNTEKYLRTFPDTATVLQGLRQKGHKIAVCSNKVHEAVLQGLKVGKIAEYVDLIVGFDDVKKPKPDPEGVVLIQERFGKKAVFVGDSPIDIMTAKNAGIKSIGVTWALTKAETLKQAGADYLVNSMKDLGRLMEEINV